MGKLRQKPNQTLPMVLAEALREAILDGELQAGQQLKQEELAQQFESSLIPVREALRNLETEGLVTIYPNKGAFVTRLSPERIREIFETRILIELGALEQSLAHLTPEDLDRAAVYLEQLDQAKQKKELSQLNKQFHQLLYSRCGNDFLLEIIDSLHRSVDRYMRYYLADHYHQKSSQHSHQQLLAAVRCKDLKLAKARLEAHMRQAMEELVAILSASQAGRKTEQKQGR